MSVAVFGGGGYVGSHILRALRAKYPSVPLLSISRSGKPAFPTAKVAGVEYISGDLTDSKGAWGPLLKEKGVTGCVSCVGAFGSNEFMIKVNGEANATCAQVASEQGVARFVYVSTVDNDLPDFVLKGYFQGKRQAEAAVLRLFPAPGAGTILRPSFVYGTRSVSATASIPLGLVGKPMEAVLTCFPFNQLQRLPGMRAVLAPPVAVEHVAAVAAAAAVGSLDTKAPQILDVEYIRSTGLKLV